MTVMLGVLNVWFSSKRPIYFGVQVIEVAVFPYIMGSSRCLFQICHNKGITTVGIFFMSTYIEWVYLVDAWLWLKERAGR